MNQAKLRDDRGASLIMVAMSLMLLMGAAAIAIDLAALRLDRSADQKVTDSAASAGALAIYETGSPQDACRTAMAYVAINSEEIGLPSPFDCDLLDFPFPQACDPGDVRSETYT